jgi:hypothetical protein
VANEAELWTSECGKYLAYRRPNSDGGIEYDVIEIGTNEVWFGRRYIPTGFDDDDPRYLYPEFARMVYAWSNAGHTTRTGRYIRAFALSFSEYNRTVSNAETWKAGFVAAISKRYGKAMFRRMVPRRHRKKYALAAAIVALSLFVEQVTSPHADEIHRRTREREKGRVN